MPDNTEFEWSTEATRRETAALLRDVADGVDAGEVVLDDGETAVTAAVPDEMALEIELSADGSSVELEMEVEWPETTSPSVEEANGAAASTTEADDPGQTSQEDPADLPAVLTAADGPSGSRATFEVYRDRADEWRWRLVHDNGNIVADSGEGYARRATAINGLHSVKHNAPGADVSVQD